MPVVRVLRDSAVTVPHISGDLSALIDACAEDEIRDARDRWPEREDERRRRARLLSLKKRAERSLRELELIAGAIGWSYTSEDGSPHGRALILRKLEDLRFSLLNPGTG